MVTFKISKKTLRGFKSNSMAIAVLPLHLYLPETADASSRSVFLVSVPILFSERETRHDRTQDETQSNAGGDAIECRRRRNRMQEGVR